ncbi:Platinum sensitivity protein, partial [Mortierella alpina]
MSNLYYRKDIHKSIEGLLYGLFVYQYLLDTSTFGLVIRCLVQDQLLSLKSKAPTLRVALYTIFAIVLLAFLRHLHPPDRYAVIIDFIGNADQDDQTAEYYVDEEEVRFSEDGDRRPPHHRASETTRSSAFGSGTDGGTGSDSEESEESEDPFGDDYEEILQQETFVFQLSLEDLTSYLFSSQDADKSEGTLVVRSELEEKEVLLSSRIRVGDDLYQRQQDLSNLTEIQELVQGAHADVAERVKLAAFIVIDNYIDKLLPVLEACEDLESVSDLHALHSILLGIIHLNDIAIIQYILKDDIFVGCVGILEYDPNLQDPKQELREMLRNGSKYKQLVPIKDQDIEQKIHQVFRLQFLRDIVLTRFLDDGLSSILGSLIFFHNIDIVNYIHQDRTFLSELIGILRQDSETAERRRDVVRFIQQFCYIARTTQMPTRASIYRKLCQAGLFSVFEFALADSEPRIRMAGVEITLSAMEHDSNLIRSHVVARADEPDQKQLFEIIVDQFLAEQDSGIMTQFAEVIRILLDMNIGLTEGGMVMTTDGAGYLDQEGNKFLDLFYSSYIHKLVSPLMAISNDTTVFERGRASRCENVCHIMSFIIRQHSYRSKNFILSNDFVQQTCLLLKNRDRHLRLVALKFLRTCIGLKDEDYNGHLIELDVFTDVMDLFLATQNRNNLVNSVCLEFFDFIVM